MVALRVDVCRQVARRERRDPVARRAVKRAVDRGEPSAESSPEAFEMVDERARRCVPAHRRAGDARERADVGLQFAFVPLGAGRLVVPKRANHGDGALRGLSRREEVEPPRDEDVRGENLEIGDGVALRRPVGVSPRLLGDEAAREREALVDELDADCPFDDAGGGRLVRGDRSGTDERQNRGEHRGVGEPVVDGAAQVGWLDVVERRPRGLTGSHGVVHRRLVAGAGAKTFGNPLSPGRRAMIRVDDDAARGVRTVTLDRPERRNALTTGMLDDLAAAVETGLPVVLLRGAGSAFCAGADLEEVASLTDDGDPEAFAEHGQVTMRAVAEAPATVVAGVDGAARGGGVELALAADLRVATPDASFGEPGVSFGLFGTWGGTHRLPRVVGPSAAADLGLTGRAVDATEAKKMGLVSRVVDDPTEVAVETAANDPHALAVLRDCLRDDRSIADRERAEREAFARLIDRHGNDL